MEAVLPVTADEKARYTEMLGTILTEAAADPEGWVFSAAVGNALAARQIVYKKHAARLRDFLLLFPELLELRDSVERPDKPPVLYVRLRPGTAVTATAAPSSQPAPAAQSVPTASAPAAEPTLSPTDQAHCAAVLTAALRSLQTQPGEWVDLAPFGAALAGAGLSYKQYGFAKLQAFLAAFPELLEYRVVTPEESSKTPVRYVRLRPGTAVAATAQPCQPSQPALPSQPVPPASAPAAEPTLSPADQAHCAAVLTAALRSLQTQPGEWVDLAPFGAALAGAGLSYKQYGFAKLQAFLAAFPELLEYRVVTPEESSKTPVRYVRLRPGTAAATTAAPLPKVPPQPQLQRTPSPDIDLFAWAAISGNNLEILARLALPEDWSGGSDDPRNAYAVLRRYLKYTFLRLVYEKKILISHDPESDDPQDEYASFNTGLVDRKYEYIYALFKKCTVDKGNRYWRLVAFAIPGEDAGKTLIRVFNPLPKKADYFENRIENMFYDTSTGALSCDYTHMLIERCSRLPADFLWDNCPVEMLSIDGMGLDTAEALNALDSRRIAYFARLGERIREDPRTLNRLKNRLQDATDLALKRVEWNYKTAIPMYFPRQNRGSLLLPLALVDESKVDLALVVSRHSNGSYQGETVLPLSLAYQDSRLVSRPDSDWLQPGLLAAAERAALNDEDDLDDED